MEIRELPPAIEPDYWNVVFHPSEGILPRLVLGRFQHVSAFTYIPGTRAWILYDCQWGGTRIMLLPRVNVLVAYTSGCTVVKFDRIYKPMLFASRIGFFCVPAIKHLLGIDSFSMRPDALFKDCLKYGGVVISEQNPAASDRQSMANSECGQATQVREKPPCDQTGAVTDIA